MTKEQTQDLIKVASTAFAVYSVVKTIRDARNDSDGLQLAEALLRGATLALSVEPVMSRSCNGARGMSGSTLSI